MNHKLDINYEYQNIYICEEIYQEKIIPCWLKITTMYIKGNKFFKKEIQDIELRKNRKLNFPDYKNFISVLKKIKISRNTIYKLENKEKNFKLYFWQWLKIHKIYSYDILEKIGYIIRGKREKQLYKQYKELKEKLLSEKTIIETIIKNNL